MIDKRTFDRGELFLTLPGGNKLSVQRLELEENGDLLMWPYVDESIDPLPEFDTVRPIAATVKPRVRSIRSGGAS